MMLALFSAVTTAITHSLLKGGKNKVAIRVWVSMLCCAVALPLAYFQPWPPAYLWPWLLLSALLHAIYQFLLIWSYEISDFSSAFPVARGSSPLFAAIMGIVFLGDYLGIYVMLGIVAICAGIGSFALFGKMSSAGLVAALLTGLLTALYTVVDANSVRLAPTALLFITWSYILEVIAMPTYFLLRYRSRGAAILRADFRHGALAAVGTLFSFGSALFALRLAPVGAVSALRELSVVFGLVLAALFLKEKIDTQRILGAALVMAGAIAVIILTK